MVLLNRRRQRRVSRDHTRAPLSCGGRAQGPHEPLAGSRRFEITDRATVVSWKRRPTGRRKAGVRPRSEVVVAEPAGRHGRCRRLRMRQGDEPDARSRTRKGVMAVRPAGRRRASLHRSNGDVSANCAPASTRVARRPRGPGRPWGLSKRRGGHGEEPAERRLWVLRATRARRLRRPSGAASPFGNRIRGVQAGPGQRPASFHPAIASVGPSDVSPLRSGPASTARKATVRNLHSERS